MTYKLVGGVQHYFQVGFCRDDCFARNVLNFINFINSRGVVSLRTWFFTSKDFCRYTHIYRFFFTASPFFVIWFHTAIRRRPIPNGTNDNSLLVSPRPVPPTPDVFVTPAWDINETRTRNV